MEWFFALFVVHLIALWVCWHLYPGAPCWMQKLAMIGIGLGMAFMAAGYLLQLLEFYLLGWPAVVFGLGVEHTAVLLYLFKTWWQKDHPPQKEKAEWATSSAHSPSSST